MNNNIILIGMPGSGKSTVGVVYAKILGYDFIDLDLIISRRAKDTLQNIINNHGLDEFLKLEEEVACSIQSQDTIIATGGSVVLSKKGMAHLKSLGTVVFFDLSFNAVKKRIRNISSRGIAFLPSQTLLDVYNTRIKLYRKYADITINCTYKDIPAVLDELEQANLTSR